MDLSVVLITYNRADGLRETLGSLSAVHVPAGTSCELLVVDNNSTDQTRAVVERFFEGSPLPGRYVLEPVQGTNHARNRGVREAGGALVAFVDDDMLFTPEWLVEMVRAFAEHPGTWAIAGRVTPRFPGAVPDWLSEALLTPYGRQDLGDAARDMGRRHPVEMNLGLRRWVFEQVGEFSTRLCRTGASLIGNDGSVFFEKFFAAGGRATYAPGAHAFHLIPEHRARKEWLLDRMYWQGVSDVRLEQVTRPRGRPALLLRAARHAAACGYLRAALALSYLAPPRDPERARMRTRAWLNCNLGAARQALREFVSPS